MKRGTSKSPSTLLASCALAIIVSGCGSEEVLPPTYPPGTVLAIGDKTISAQDVDRWLEAIELIEPGRSKAGQRRLALTNIELHRVIASQIDIASYEQARADAQAARELLLAGEALPAEGPQVETIIEGYWREIGIDLWHLARRAPIGEWSEVHESTAYFVIFRVTARDPEPWSRDEGAALEQVVFPYLEEGTAKDIIGQAESLFQLTIVDPAWDELVPAHYKYMMGVQPNARRETAAPE